MIQARFTTRWPIDEELKKLVEATKEQPRGSLVKHSEIEAVTGLTRDVAPWQKLIRHWRNKMRATRQIEIISEPGIGYRLATVDEQMQLAMRLEKSGGRRLGKAKIAAGSVEPSELTDEGRQLQDKIVADIDRVQLLQREQRAERRSLISMQPALPRLAKTS